MSDINVKISEETIKVSTIGTLSSHSIAGGSHTAGTLEDFNKKLSDADLTEAAKFEEGERERLLWITKTTDHGNVSGSVSFDASASFYHELTLTGDTTLSVTNTVDYHDRIRLKIHNPDSYDLTLSDPSSDLSGKNIAEDGYSEFLLFYFV